MQALTCPSCGAPLSVTGAQATVRCAYCGASVAVPEVRRPPIGDPLLPDPSLAEVAALFRDGRRVQATIRYREITGATLPEARAALDAFAAGQPLRRPNRMGR